MALRVQDGKSLFGATSALAAPFRALAIVCRPVAADMPVRSEADSAFKGKIGVSATESTPDWPKSVEAPHGAPNIVLILLDDIGFADTSVFGGAAQTPELNKLAMQGLRYNNFNTAAMCSPTRAALLTGRNHHRVGFGTISDAAGGYPGYNSVWKESTASIAQVLKLNGYSTAAFGKWHNTPLWEITPTGPFDRWPTGLGFEYFYGFMGGADNQWEPAKLYRNTTPVDPPATPQQGYHLTADMTDEAISWIRTHDSLAAGKPYFLYFATGAVHSPHHAPKEWIDRYKGRFDRGWDELNKEIFARQKKLGVIPADARLTPRPKEIPAWNSLSADQKQLYARQMEVYAGFVAHTDAQVGRLLEAVRSAPGGDNTLIMYIVGDNGAAGEWSLHGSTSITFDVQEQLKDLDKLGGPEVSFNIYSKGWAWAGSSPFRYWKTIASHFGSTRNPLVVSWPERIKMGGGIRSQFTHVNDVAATLYEAAGVTFPEIFAGVEQQQLDGASFLSTFNESGARSTHRTQYFEMRGNRAIYQDGWVASARHEGGEVWLPATNADFASDRWELFHVAEDFSEARDLAKSHPQKLKELKALFDSEAWKNDVYPLGGAFSRGKPSLTSERQEFVYYPSTSRIPDALIPVAFTSYVSGQLSYRITADVLIPDQGAEGVLAAYGDRVSGFVWYVKDGCLVYENRVGAQRQVLVSQVALPRGRAMLAFALKRDELRKDKPWWEQAASGTGYLYINGQLAAQAKLPAVWRASTRALWLGRSENLPVSPAFEPPFEFTGVLDKVTIELQ